MIRTAVILAAGRGSRLGSETSKPLAQVGGVSLIGRVLQGLRQVGVREVVVVLGYEADRVRAAVAGGLGADLSVTFVINDSWRRSNGLSLLAARHCVDGPFLLLMSDHLVEPAIFESIAQAPLDRHAGVLAIDRAAELVFDLDDATKVLLDGDRIDRIGKELTRYNAVDTGVFALQPRIFDELQLAADQNGGDCSLSQGIERLCRAGLMGWRDVTGLAWLDVDTPQARARAEEWLAQGFGGSDLASLSSNLTKA